MRYILLLIVSVAFLSAESYEDHIFPIKLSIDSSSSPAFVFEWAQDTNSLKYIVSKKVYTDSSFGKPIAILSGDAVGFADSSIAKGVHYEYKFENYQTEISTYNYVSVGFDLPIKERTSVLLLIADNTDLPDNYKTYRDLLLSGHLNIYEQTMPASLEFDKEKNIEIKQTIQSFVAKDSTIRYVLLIGNVPIPYSGNFSPDGHNDHIGAYPADIWFAEMDGDWSDEIIDADSASASRQHNFPGDGKFDNYYLPSKSELIIARIDFRNLPDFAETETELFERYFEKNIRYRTSLYKPQASAFISDGFVSYGGFPATTIYNQFASLFGEDNITQKNMRDSMSSGNYTMAYACGSGGYESILLTLYSADMAKQDYDAVFLSCFGSWLCDWDSQNNLLRAAIASKPSILCSWFANRPQIPLHNLGLGNTIGDAIYAAQNNKTLYEYWYNNYLQGVHLNLIGDPTLKLRHIDMPADLSLLKGENGLEINWNPSPNAEYYNIYKSNSENSTGIKINKEPLTKLNYLEKKMLSGKFYYTVTAVEKVTTPNGSYYEESAGIRDSIELYPNEDIVVYLANPAQAGVIGEISIAMKEKASIAYSLSNSAGQVVLSGNTINRSYNHFLNFNTILVPGAYFLNIESSAGKKKNIKIAVIR